MTSFFGKANAIVDCVVIAGTLPAFLFVSVEFSKETMSFLDSTKSSLLFMLFTDRYLEQTHDHDCRRTLDRHMLYPPGDSRWHQ